MKSKKHILLLTPGFPESNNDSTCIPALQALVDSLQQNYADEVKISVVSFQYPFKKGAYVWKGISCWSAGGSNRRLPRKIITWINVMQFALRLHRQHPISIIHSFWLHDCTLIGQWLSRITGAKLIAHIMGQDVLPGNRYFKFITFNNVYIIANSPFAAAELEKNYKIRPDDIIPFGIDEKDFGHVSIAEQRVIDLLNVGSLTSVKNQQLFIEIFAEVHKHFNDLRGCIIGEGPLEHELRMLIVKLGLEANLALTGKLDRKSVLQKMAESSILVHTAPFESAGYVFPEALFSGMKVVSFPTGYLPPSGASFACRDKKEMLETVLHLLNNPVANSKVHVPLIAETSKKVFDTWLRLSS